LFLIEALFLSFRRIKSEFNDQKSKLELLTVNYEELKAKNAQLTADADQSNDERNLKEEMFLSQVNDVKRCVQCDIVLYAIALFLYLIRWEVLCDIFKSIESLIKMHCLNDSHNISDYCFHFLYSHSEFTFDYLIIS
jgi:FtsZ-binding cell division protein ZapB